MEFSGTAQKYRRFAIISSLVINLYLYFGLAAVVYLHEGTTWVFSLKPTLVAVVFAALYARIAYRWMMRLDAQYGSGRGWVLKSRRLKLPERGPGK